MLKEKQKALPNRKKLTKANKWSSVQDYQVMTTTFRRLFGILTLASLLLVSGCASKLQEGGAYAPDPTTNAVTGIVTTIAADKPFFVVDSAFYLAYSAVDAAFTFERDNRATLWKLSPQIKHDLDAIRPDAVLARNAYMAARKSYIANPTPAGLDTLSTVLAKVQQLQTTANAVINSLPKTP